MSYRILHPHWCSLLREKCFWGVTYAVEGIHDHLAKYELVVTIKICFFTAELLAAFLQGILQQSF